MFAGLDVFDAALARMLLGGICPMCYTALCSTTCGNDAANIGSR